MEKNKEKPLAISTFIKNRKILMGFLITLAVTYIYFFNFFLIKNIYFHINIFLF